MAALVLVLVVGPSVVYCVVLWFLERNRGGDRTWPGDWR